MTYDGEPAWLSGRARPAPKHFGCIAAAMLAFIAMSVGLTVGVVVLLWVSVARGQDEPAPPLESRNGQLGCSTCATAPLPAPDALVKGTGTGQGLVAYTGNACAVPGQFARGIDPAGDLTCATPPASADTWCGSGQTCDPTDVGLGPLAAGEAWVGAAFTPTDIATQAELAVGLGGKQSSLPTLGSGEGWLGPVATPTDLATQAELTAGLGAKQASLPTLAAGQGWLGAAFTPTTLARATSASPADGCAQWASGTLGTTSTACGAGAGGVTQITAGNAVTIAPAGGTGTVIVGVTAPTTGATEKTTWNGTAFVNAPDLTCNDASVSCLFAGSASEGGPATTALALDTDPTDCAASSFARGIAANGVAACSGALTSGTAWVGATATPTDIATQVELNAVATAKQGVLPTLAAAEGWLGPSATPTDLATQAELNAVDAAKQASLPTLGAGQGWLGVASTPTILARASGASPIDGCATWSSGVIGSMGAPCGVGGGGGGVASVGLALPGEFTVTGSPVTSAGTLTGAWTSQAARAVLAGPTGATGTPAFRALGLADVGEPTQNGTGLLVRDTGTVSFATRLASNGSNCTTAGQFATGVSALGVAEGCATPTDTWCGSGQTCTPTSVGLGALAASEAWVGPTFTATDIATQAELTAGLATKQGTLATLTSGQLWLGPTPATAVGSTGTGTVARAIDAALTGTPTVNGVAISTLTRAGVVPIDLTLAGDVTVSGLTDTSIVTRSGTALASLATPTLCPSGQYARGITTAGQATGCTTAATGGGSGDMVGPASSVAEHVVAFADTTGKLAKDSGIELTTATVDPSGACSPRGALKVNTTTGAVFSCAG